MNKKQLIFEPAMVNLMTKCEAALTYADQGWRVFPCEPGRDRPHPAIALFGQPTVDERIIRKWFARYPDANIGIATGGISKLWVVEIFYGSKEEKHAVIEKVSGIFPVIAKAIQPNSNVELYVRPPAGGTMGWHVSLACGIVVGDGGRVIAPPSKLGGCGYVAFGRGGQ